MVASTLDICPQCGTDHTKARAVLDAELLSRCLKCEFPLVLVAGKYRLKRILGEGGFGVVYLAHHVQLERDNERVVKILRPDVFDEPGMKKRFRREVQLTSELSQRNEHIVRVFDDFGEIPRLGRFYVMEYLDGQQLSEHMEQADQQRLPMELCFHVFRQLCETMQFAHDSEVVHRDLKPENLFLILDKEENYFLKVLDFGIAKPIKDRERKQSKLTNVTKGAVGTPLYMSPEQCTNESIDARSDIYAMGCLLYEMLTGVSPFRLNDRGEERSLVEVMQAHVSLSPPSPRALCPERVSPAMEMVLMRALEKEPCYRFQTAHDFLRALNILDPAHPSTGALPKARTKLIPRLPSGGLGSVATKHSSGFGARTYESTNENVSAYRWLWGTLGFVGLVVVGIVGSRFWSPTAKSMEVKRASGPPPLGVVKLQSPLKERSTRRGAEPKLLPKGKKVSRKKPPPKQRSQHQIERRAKVRRHRLNRRLRRRWKPRQEVLRKRVGERRGKGRRVEPRERIRAMVGATTPSVSKKVVQRLSVAQRVVRPPPVVVRTPPLPRRPKSPILGCPPAKKGERWVRLNISPRRAEVQLRVLRGRMSTKLRRSFGYCISILGKVRVKLALSEHTPCRFSLPFKHTRKTVSLRKVTFHDIEVSDYCTKK